MALAVFLTGCAAFDVGTYDKDAADRVTAIAKSVLTYYDDLLAIEEKDRLNAMKSSFIKRAGEVRLQLRLHQMKEKVRANNTDGVNATDNLLLSWSNFTKSQASGEKTTLSDDQLAAQLTILERHLNSAFRAEEAKKLVGTAKPQ